jgi:hypothetical protein
MESNIHEKKIQLHLTKPCIEIKRQKSLQELRLESIHDNTFHHSDAIILIICGLFFHESIERVFE